jgi:AraC family transcriptional regulator, regulatory protein of adaptative response / methylated-DNA-[protein]-cysteine methyltransferase
MARAQNSNAISRAAAVMRDSRWADLCARNTDADGAFYYSVQTTGVYCRPSCGARLARPENVRFHLTCADAESAGFRPCKRCRPREADAAGHGEKVAAACRRIEAAERAPQLHELACQAGLSAYHFHRVFKAATGLTPRQYAKAHRQNRMRAALQEDATVTEAIYDAGYNSSGWFYAEAEQMLGMKPTEYRKGGAGADIRFAVGECSLGQILVAQSERGICAILIGDDAGELVRDLQDRFPNANLLGGEPRFKKLVARVIAFVEAPARGLDLPLDIRGTAFQQRVWEILRKIPAGATLSYSEIARRMGAPKAARAVAQSCAANALAVAIPCHRVVRNDGGISGYRWGVERKRALLKRESAARGERQPLPVR